MRQRLKYFLERVAPSTFRVIQAIRARRLVNSLQRKWGLQALADEFVRRNGLTVLNGPFAGMHLTARTTWSNRVAKLLGVYEMELYPDLEAIMQTPFETAVDVGCADGYFAIGLARRLPSARVWAFDIDPLARKVVREMAKLNGVAERLTVAGACTPPKLQSALRGRALLFCDCEGYEMQLIDPQAVPALSSADLIVEFHENEVPQVASVISARLEKTHHVEICQIRARYPKDFRQLEYLEPADANRIIQEIRPPGQTWGIFRSRKSHGFDGFS